MTKKLGWVLIVGLLLSVWACKPPAPIPSHYVDLGTEDKPLPPPPPAWHDPAVAKGTADWKPFRKLESGGAKTASAKPAVDSQPGTTDDEKPAAKVGGGPEEDIRTLVADFNAALEENKLEEATEFLTDAQAEFSKDVISSVNDLVEQLRALAAAVPATAPKVDALAPVLNLGGALRMKLASIQVEGKTATAKLESGGEAKFMVGEEELWYLESPLMNVLNAEKARMQKLAEDIKAALASGTPEDAKVNEISTALDELNAALNAVPKPAGEDS